MESMAAIYVKVIVIKETLRRHRPPQDFFGSSRRHFSVAPKRYKKKRITVCLGETAVVPDALSPTDKGLNLMVVGGKLPPLSGSQQQGNSLLAICSNCQYKHDSSDCTI